MSRLGLLRSLLRIRKLAIALSTLIIVISIGVIGPLIYRVDPSAVFQANKPPSSEHPLGTDSRGRDILAQLLAGIKGSLYIGLLSAPIAVLIGVLIGITAGYRRGYIDSLLMLVTDIFLVLPTYLLLILIAAYVKVRTPLVIALIIGITSWPWMAKSIRAQVMSLKQREFLYMSRMGGLSDLRIMIEDILPSIASYIFIVFTSAMSGAMIAEAGLSMLGLGITEGASLGFILFWAQQFDAVRRGMWWWFIPPGALLVAIAVSLYTIATSLDEFFNPRLRE